MSRTSVRPGHALAACVVAVAVLVLALVVPVGPARGIVAADHVAIGHTGQLGRFGGAVVEVTVTCRPGELVADLVVRVTQSSLTGSVDAGVSGSRSLTCDSVGHRVEVPIDGGTGPSFVAGAATVEVRLSLLDATTMDPLPQVVVTAVVRLLPAADVRVLRPLWRVGGGAVRVPLLLRCQMPWVGPSFTVDVSQRGGAIAGGTGGDAAITCDGRWHRMRVLVAPGSDQFSVGPTRVAVTLTVFAPIDLDPVAQARTTVNRWARTR